MASGKLSDDIRKNEEYMNDASFEIFSNLHKAAKRKSDYKWSTNNFISPDSICDETKTNKIDYINERKNSKYKWEISKQQNADNINSSNSKILESSSNSESKSCDVKWKTDERKQVSHQSAPDFLDDHDVFRSNQSCNAKSVTGVKVPISPNGISNATPSPSAGKMQKSYLNETNYQNREKDFTADNNTKFCDKIQKRDLISHAYLPIKESKVNVVINNVTSSAISKDCNRETMDRNFGKKSEQKYPNKGKFWSMKHTIDDSEPSEDNLPSEKKLSVKIINANLDFEFIVNLSDFKCIRKKFPKLQKILPDIDAEGKQINYAADAVKAVFGSLFNLPCNFNMIRNGRTAVEILSAAKSWEMNQFYSEFQETILTKLTKEDIEFIYPAAVHYSLKEICDACKALLPDSVVVCNKKLNQRKCSVSISKYIEPRDFDVPLQTTTYLTCDDSFPKDISNDIIFEAIAGSYVITGFHILLNTDNMNTDSRKFDIFYGEEWMEINKPLHNTIEVFLKKKLTVNEKQKVKITIETQIKPYLCKATGENSIVGKCEEGKFSLNLKSNYKVNNSNKKRFLVGKLLYYPITKE